MINPYSSRSRRHRDAAYTLFEIMLVLGIIAVLVGAAIYKLVGTVDVAKVQRVDTDVQTITTQLSAYEMMNYSMPTTSQGLEALVNRPTVEPLPKRWTQLMTEVPQDPWHHPYQYSNPGKKNAGGFDIYSMGPDGMPNTPDDIWPAK